IAAKRQKVLTQISGLTGSQLGYRPEGGWSIQDIVHHLALTDEANLKLFQNFLKQSEAAALPPDSTPDLLVSNCMDDFFDKVSGSKLNAPPRVTPREPLEIEQSLGRLASSRARLREIVEKLSTFDLSELKFPHPAAGDLNAYQWLAVVGGHEARHAAQIE